MRTKDIVVGAEYAIGSNDGRCDRFRRIRGQVLEVAVTRRTRNHDWGRGSVTHDGIKVQVLTDWRGEAPKSERIEVYRPQEIRMLWIDFEPLKAEHDRVEAELADLIQVARTRAVAVLDRLRRTGFRASCANTRGVTLNLDDAEKLLDMLADRIDGAVPQAGDGECRCTRHETIPHPFWDGCKEELRSGEENQS